MTIDVAVIGGGLAGAAIATHLGRAGREVVIFERAPDWRWRAGGVFTSPATVAALRRLGLDGGGPRPGRPPGARDAGRDTARRRVPPDLRRPRHARGAGRSASIGRCSTRFSSSLPRRPAPTSGPG